MSLLRVNGAREDMDSLICGVVSGVQEALTYQLEEEEERQGCGEVGGRWGGR